MVKEIKRIRAELYVDSLGYFGVLDQRQVQVRESGTIESVAPQIAEGVSCGDAERRRSIGNPLGRIPADLHRADQIRANGVASTRRVGCGEDDVEWIPALYGQDGRHFPSADEAVAFEGQVVNGIRHEPMPGVKIGRPATAENVRAVLNDNPGIVARDFVDRVRIGIGSVELQPMRQVLVRRNP